MEDFERALTSLPDVDVEPEEEHDQKIREAELEGEITRRKLDARRAPEKGKRFSLRPGK